MMDGKQAPLKRRSVSTGLHDTISQKIVIFRFIKLTSCVVKVGAMVKEVGW
jgi:hypothetical protein